MRIAARAKRTSARASAAAIAAALALATPAAHAADAPKPAATRAAAKRFDVAVVNGRIAGGADTVVVAQGDDVEIRITSDRPLELHLHGYDVERSVRPNETAVLAFKATIAGRFPVSVHGAGRERALVYLEVHP